MLLNRVFDDSEELFLLNRLNQIILDALLHEFRGGLDIWMACHDDDRDGRELLLKMLDGSESVDLWHLHVAENHVYHEGVIVGLDCLNALFTVLRLDHVVSCFGQDHFDCGSNMRLIIHHENSPQSHMASFNVPMNLTKSNICSSCARASSLTRNSRIMAEGLVLPSFPWRAAGRSWSEHQSGAGLPLLLSRSGPRGGEDV